MIAGSLGFTGHALGVWGGAWATGRRRLSPVSTGSYSPGPPERQPAAICPHGAAFGNVRCNMPGRVPPPVSTCDGPQGLKAAASRRNDRRRQTVFCGSFSPRAASASIRLACRPDFLQGDLTLARFWHARCSSGQIVGDRGPRPTVILKWGLRSSRSYGRLPLTRTAKTGCSCRVRGPTFFFFFR